MPPGAAADSHFLQAGDIGVDFAQYRGDSAGIIAPVDPDAGVDVIGYHTNRVVLGSCEPMRSNTGAAVDFCAASTCSVQK